ncbi:DUF7281 domain-containing protein [Flavobacterium sp. W21_SRS_FM6]|uniref:DUF7281 domain-containing protein n=1 Tax=Flavobacterium sp. W21_SRS_FM6 TaxID=3240268 RepID=UPI003F923BC8
MELGKSEIATLSRFFRDENKLLLASKGKLKQWLEQHFDLYHNGKHFVFNPVSKETLRREIERSYPRLNLLAGLASDQDRVAIIAQSNNDKLADSKPNDKYVLAKCLAKFELDGHRLMLPLGTSVRLLVERIDLSQFSSIVVVENLDVFDKWHHVTMQDNKHSLVVYRGHDQATAKGLKYLLSQLPLDIEVIMFPDLDPKGLEISFTTPRINRVLAPKISDIHNVLRPYSQPEVFLQQHSAVAFLSQQHSPRWQELVTIVKTHKLAVMQQVFIALNIPLVCYK